MPSGCCVVDETERKVEFDLFDRYRVCTGCNQLQPTTTACDLPRKGLRSIPTIALGAPRTALNAFGTQRSLVQIQSPRPLQLRRSQTCANLLEEGSATSLRRSPNHSGFSNRRGDRDEEQGDENEEDGMRTAPSTWNEQVSTFLASSSPMRCTESLVPGWAPVIKGNTSWPGAAR